MPAKKKPEKTSQAETEKRKNSGVKEKAEKPVVIGTKEFFEIEDALADKSTAEEDADSFERLGTQLTGLLGEYDQEAKKSKPAEATLASLQTEIMLAIMQMRRLNRLAQFRNKKMRDKVAEERQKVEEQHLQLQNLLYEVSHIEKEVEKCLEFKSDHEDIDLIPVDQFYKEAPESIAKPAVTKQDTHAQRLARLTWELETRKRLESDLEKLETEKAQLLKHITGDQEQLSAMQPKLEALLEASRPLQEALDMSYEKETVQREYAAYLPACLYYLYVQALAYKEVFDSNLCVNVEGDLDRVKKMLADKRNEALANEDDDESEDSESENEGKKHEGQHHSQKKEGHQRRQTITETITEENPRDVLDPFPLQVELKTTYKEKATIYLKFFYIEYLGVISVKSRLELMAALPRAVATANDLLSDDTMLAWLFAGDDGLTCPNPAGAIKLGYSNLELRSKIEVIGRLYEWAQRLAGLTFPRRKDDDTENSDGVFKDEGSEGMAETSTGPGGTDDAGHFFHSVLQRIQRRVYARLSLQEQFAAFESLNVYPPKEVLSWFPVKIHSRMTKWTSMTYDDFICHPASEGSRKGVPEEGWFCSVTVERGSAKLVALVAISVDYPHTAPLFCLLLIWNGNVVNAEKSSDLWHLTRAVNVDCVRHIPKSIISRTLSVQLQFLISRLDVVLEIESLEQGGKEFQLEHLFQGYRRGRDRKLPLWFNESRNCYSFDNN